MSWYDFYTQALDALDMLNDPEKYLDEQEILTLIEREADLLADY